MTHHKTLSENAFKKLKCGRVFVPSPLALDNSGKNLEKYQRLLTLYYIKSGATAVVPGAHTGEFALGNLELYENWLRLVKEMTIAYGEQMILMAAVGGEDALKQAELAAKYEYDIVMIAPTAFTQLDDTGVIDLWSKIAQIIPTFAFELQKAIPGSREFSSALWDQIFEISYGAKGASFDTYRSINMMQSAAAAPRSDQLVMLTGNDDRIVADFLTKFNFNEKYKTYTGGLLGHFATDTHAVLQWTDKVFQYRDKGSNNFSLSIADLSHAVNHCNMVLFDALGNFENSVWGLKYRLTKLGLLPSPYCAHESGRAGQAESIDHVYANYPMLTDHEFIGEHLEWLKKEVELK